MRVLTLNFCGVCFFFVFYLDRVPVCMCKCTSTRSLLGVKLRNKLVTRTKNQERITKYWVEYNVCVSVLPPTRPWCGVKVKNTNLYVRHLSPPPTFFTDYHWKRNFFFVADVYIHTAQCFFFLGTCCEFVGCEFPGWVEACLREKIKGRFKKIIPRMLVNTRFFFYDAY